MDVVAQLPMFPGDAPCVACGGAGVQCPACAVRVLAAPRAVRVALVGCGARKREGVHAARDLYVGTLFRWSLEFAEATCSAAFVLSAKHGLVAPDDPLTCYDHVLPRSRAGLEVWGRGVGAALAARVATREVHVVLLAGRLYAEALSHLPAGWTWEAPLAGLQIGERLHWLAEERRARGARRIDMGDATVLRAEQLRVGDRVLGFLSKGALARDIAVRSLRRDGADILLGAEEHGAAIRVSVPAGELVRVDGLRALSLRRPPVREVAQREGAEAFAAAERAVARWTAEAGRGSVSPGHRRLLASLLVQVGGGSDITEDLRSLVLWSGSPVVYSEALAQCGLPRAVQAEFDGLWLEYAEGEIRGDAARLPPLWPLRVGPGVRAVVVTERAVDALAYRAFAGRDGMAFIATCGRLEGEVKSQVHSFLTTLPGVGGPGAGVVVVAAFGATREGAEAARVLRSLLPAGVGFDRHAPQRGEWLDCGAMERSRPGPARAR